MHTSDHTRLINKFICLCKKTKNWPRILTDLGYKVQLIEQAISIESADKITPDVIAVSKKLKHVVVADCKSGYNIDSDQDSRYQRLASADLVSYVTIHDSNQLRHVVCYVDSNTNHDSLKPQTVLPFITFGTDSMHGDGDFGLDELNKALCKTISLAGMEEPTSYYPFSPEDEDWLVAPHVLRGIISYTIRTKNVRQTIDPIEILKLIHPFALISIRH